MKKAILLTLALIRSSWAFQLPSIRLLKIANNPFTRCSLRRHSRSINIHGRIVAYDRIPKEIQSLVDSLEAVKSLPRIRENKSFEDFNGLAVVDPKTKPTFRRLFTHETWKLHAGGSTFRRWLRCMAATPSSVILRAVAKTVGFLSIWSAFAAYFAPKLFSSALRSQISDQSLPLSLCGNAIGLLLVFRTNEAYKRLEEARELMEKVVHHSGEIVSYLGSAWEPHNQDDPQSVKTSTMALVGRYLAAFAWSLRDELRDGDTRDDVLNTLLPKEEAKWVSNQRSRALAIHGQLRRLIFKEWKSGRFPDQQHFHAEVQLNLLSSAAATCERIFTSPIPPTMSRHGLRSMTLLMLTLPVALSFAVPPIVNIGWTAAIGFIYLGIDELGVQVEQPFRLIPMWQLCQLVQEDIMEFSLHPLELHAAE
mmetsp:Transcript_18897/g.27963  ORF Transcript_18897/g.27963 Transcript_18897/m.27963 type:complete len:422 (-) Transcript_18897:50-1315(-)|eukprot:CAMPEP_0194221812 /NCGR_PEP_ID=MMETSP0156-20130528/31413_1 /TAXON_ID=33649 /ORGANISM="Thalassionema nitzschioides, Strain L26-B" /LENGTH=421 /DNA_ID=CAMNT_0038952347 /DNA_START=32 /DNA_END=1297 /DNA_ORIENTATION=+